VILRDVLFFGWMIEAFGSPKLAKFSVAGIVATNSNSGISEFES
jgi:hypothetical protein